MKKLAAQNSSAPQDAFPKNHWEGCEKLAVGLSNILDGELVRRKPAKRPHGEVVGAAVVDSELHCKVIQGVEAVAGVKAFLILAVAALHFAVVSRRIGPDELMPDT